MDKSKQINIANMDKSNKELGFVNIFAAIAIGALILSAAALSVSQKTDDFYKKEIQRQTESFGALVSSTDSNETIGQFRINVNHSLDNLNHQLTDSTSSNPGHTHGTSSVTGVFGTSSGALGITDTPANGQLLSANNSTPKWKTLNGTGGVTITSTSDAITINTAALDLTASYTWTGGHSFQNGVTSTKYTLISGTSTISSTTFSNTAQFLGSTTFNGAVTGPFVKKIAVDPASTSVRTASETNLFSVTVPGGTLGTSSAVRATVQFAKFLNDAGGGTVQFKMSYGGTGFVTMAINSAQLAAVGQLTGVLMSSNSTSAQAGYMEALFTTIGGGGSTTALEDIHGFGYSSTSTIDSTVDQTFAISIDSEDANDDMNIVGVIVEQIR